MGELTQTGVAKVEKRQRWVSVRFRRAFTERPHLTVTSRVGAVARKVAPQILTRRGFKVAVNSIPFVEQNYDLTWEATGEIEPAAFVFFRWAAGIGAVLGLYATLLELKLIEPIVAVFANR